MPLNGVQKSFENITAVKHANGEDIWIITQFIDKFYAFKIDNSGLNTIPVISKVGISVPLDHDCRLGYIKISPDSKKLAIAHYSKALAIYDFNSFTGGVSNEVILDTNKHFYGVEFSPNSKILYSSENVESTIHQYDLTAISIPNSKFLLYKGNNQSYFGALQLGLDKKIYHTAINDKALSVIENPDIYGSGANFKPLSIDLGGKISTYGLSSFIVSFFNGTILINGNLNLSEFCLNEPLTFSLNTNLSTYTANWDFGDGNTVINNNTPIHTFSTFGTYLVKVTLKYKDQYENEQNITFDKTITIHPKPSVNLGPDKILCEGASLTLDAGNPGASYLWSTGETTQTINVIKSGSYSVTVTDYNNCSVSSSVIINFLNPFIKEIKVNKNTAEIVAIENSLLQYSLGYDSLAVFSCFL
ncbi:PKD domain-containing protein [Apibacter adventoris]|uniref:PKD domain-containing protein n=1 Tax=Apibacter adventoris TaxID=1679466 RepID=A0A2S8AAI1_9FLAO|nr:PKD domain-containing protein [Apibacter adventoris]PQL91553.1 hypothetical protein C4S77_07005 [Apibacter adventoris]PQL93603.1 hypothetical protein C4S76_08125 [Apibacter adventoris]